MKVRDLKEYLNTLPEDMEVFQWDHEYGIIDIIHDFEVREVFSFIRDYGNGAPHEAFDCSDPSDPNTPKSKKWHGSEISNVKKVKVLILDS